jgi:hypothetical protein
MSRIDQRKSVMRIAMGKKKCFVPLFLIDNCYFASLLYLCVMVGFTMEYTTGFMMLESASETEARIVKGGHLRCFCEFLF